MAGQNGSAPSREALKKRLFRLWDQDGDGALKKDELLKLAQATGFEGTDEEWTEEYPEMCKEKGCSVEAGLSEAAVMALLDDDSDIGCFFSDQELAEILAEAGVDTSEAMEVDAVGSPEAAVPTKDAVGSPEAAVSTKDAVGSPEAASPVPAGSPVPAEAPAPGASPDAVPAGSPAPGASPDAAAEVSTVAEKPSDAMQEEAADVPMTKEQEKEKEIEDFEAHAKERRCLKRKLFQMWDKDGDKSLRETELLQLAKATGFDGTAEEWKQEYPEMCKEKGCDATEGMSQDAVMSLLDDETDNGCYFSNGELKDIMTGAGASLDDLMSFEDSSEQVKVTLNRQALKMRLFRLWDLDRDQALKEDEMMQVAMATGFDGSTEDWHNEYVAMCEENSIKPEAGFPKEKVMDMLDDETEQGAHIATEEIRQFIEVLMEGKADPEEEKEYKVKVVRDEEMKAGFKVRQADLMITGLERPAELEPMQDGDIVKAVNGQKVEVFADYIKLAHGVKEFTCTMICPRKFKAADGWEGAMPGYAFKSGEHGLGYYRDNVGGVMTIMSGIQEFYKSGRFQGAWHGYVFKMGSLGCGYYMDTVSRGYMKKKLFKLWDRDNDGRLNKHEACQFARDTGFTGSWDQFMKEYQQMCANRSCDPEVGLTATAVSDMLEDKTDRGCYLDTADITGLIARIQGESKLRETQQKVAATVPLADLPIGRLKALSKLHNVSLAGCVEKSEIVTALRDGGVPDQGAAAAAEAAEEHLKNTSEDVTVARGTEQKISLGDATGFKKEAIVKLAPCVGWTGFDDTWVIKFKAVCLQHAVKPEEELPIAKVMALAEATKAALLERGVGEGDLDENGQPVKKKQKVMPPPKKAGAVDPKTGIPKATGAIVKNEVEKWLTTMGYNLKAMLAAKQKGITTLRQIATLPDQDDAWFEFLDAAGIGHKEARGFEKVIREAEAEAKKAGPFSGEKAEEEEKEAREKAFQAAADKARASGVVPRLPQVGKVGATPLAGAKEPPPGKKLKELSVSELKALAKKKCVDISLCFEKGEIIEKLDKMGIKPEPEPKAKEEAAKAKGKTVLPPAKAVVPKPKPGEIRPSMNQASKVNEQKMHDLYMEHREKMGPGSQWELQTGVALWRSDTGWERTHFLMPRTATGWSTVIEVMEYGEKRLKVRGMGVNRQTGCLEGLRWQMGWLELAMIMNKETGELLVTHNTQTGQVFTPKPKVPLKAIPKQHIQKDALETADPESGATTIEGVKKADVFNAKAAGDSY